MTAPAQIQIPPGLVCVTTHGSVTMETFQYLWDTRSHCDKQGLNNVQWVTMPGALVEKARNEAVRQTLRAGASWLLMIDADMTAQPDSILRLLQTAYGTHPEMDVVGAYCSLRGGAIPTIDTGTGTWEVVYPGSGVLEVMRTGAAFLLSKRHVFERIPDPWFRMRVPARPVDFLAEVDNFCRIKFDGRNPFRNLPGQPWERLEGCAAADPSSHGQWVPAEVGEDSGFCDRVKAAGMRIAVDTNIVTGHIDRKTTTWTDLKATIADRLKQQRLCVGVTA